MKAVAPAGAPPAVQQAYQVQLAHLADCTWCRLGLPCEDGRRIRRALQAARLAAEATNPMNSRRDNGGL